MEQWHIKQWRNEDTIAADRLTDQSISHQLGLVNDAGGGDYRFVKSRSINSRANYFVVWDMNSKNVAANGCLTFDRFGVSVFLNLNLPLHFSPATLWITGWTAAS